MKRILDPTTGQKLIEIVNRYDGRVRDRESSLVAVQKRLARRRR